jgi:hypothetical protein
MLLLSVCFQCLDSPQCRGRQWEFDCVLLIRDTIKMDLRWIETASVVWWSECLTTNTDVLGLIPGAARFSE